MKPSFKLLACAAALYFPGHAVAAEVPEQLASLRLAIDDLTKTTPFSPPSGPTQWLFQGPPAESKFLAAAVDENRREISLFCQIPASSGAFFLSAFQFSAFQLYPNPPFPPQPPFPRPPVYAAYFAEATKAKKAATGRPVRPNGSFRGLPQKANS
jgi:hypothetical protein